MVSLAEMAQTHLVNVENEIRRLEQQKNQIDAEIKKLSEYLQKGLQTLRLETNIEGLK